MLQEELKAELDASLLQAKKARNRFELRKAQVVLHSLKNKLEIKLQGMNSRRFVSCHRLSACLQQSILLPAMAIESIGNNLQECACFSTPFLCFLSHPPCLLHAHQVVAVDCHFYTACTHSMLLERSSIANPDDGFRTAWSLTLADTKS